MWPRRPGPGGDQQCAELVAVLGGMGLVVHPVAAGHVRPGVTLARPPAGQVGKVAVARMAPVVVTRRAPVSGPSVTGSGLPQYP